MRNRVAAKEPLAEAREEDSSAVGRCSPEELSQKMVVSGGGAAAE